MLAVLLEWGMTEYRGYLYPFACDCLRLLVHAITLCSNHPADPHTPINPIPHCPDQPFPATFKKYIEKIFSRLFRVYGHIYHSHIMEVQRIGAGPHLNTCFKVSPPFDTQLLATAVHCCPLLSTAPTLFLFFV